jgi:hypothetical protein
MERGAAQRMIVRYSPGSRRLTLGADKVYDVREFIDDLRDLNVRRTLRRTIQAGPGDRCLNDTASGL